MGGVLTIEPPVGELRELLLDGWELDRAGPEPAYAQIERRLADLIRGGIVAVGDRVPSERDLAAWVGVSRPTARAALSSLARAGMLERGAGRQGTTVARTAIVRELGSFAGFSDIARSQGITVRTTVLATHRRSAEGVVADELRVEPGSPVWYVSRLRAIDGEAAAIEETFLPIARFPDLPNHDLAGSLYKLLDEHYDGAPTSATEQLHPVVARGSVCELLGVEPGRALMLVERTGYSRFGEPVEFARDLHRADRTRFVVDINLPAI
jgi:GntR family transcriptional regulator